VVGIHEFGDAVDDLDAVALQLILCDSDFAFHDVLDACFSMTPTRFPALAP
jgi:hypothetical protein